MSNPPPASESIQDVPLGHVRLVLVRDAPFYLEIPLKIIHSLCSTPRKYLVFLGWCILGVEGGLAERHDSERMALDGALDDQGLYYYVTNGQIGKLSSTLSLLSMRTNCNLFNEDLSKAVDLEVIKDRSNVPSETTDTRNDFRNELLKRDVSCVFTGIAKKYGSGMHIIPYARGSEVGSKTVLLHWRDI